MHPGLPTRALKKQDTVPVVYRVPSNVLSPTSRVNRTWCALDAPRHAMLAAFRIEMRLRGHPDPVRTPDLTLSQQSAVSGWLRSATVAAGRPATQARASRCASFLPDQASPALTSTPVSHSPRSPWLQRACERERRDARSEPSSPECLIAGSARGAPGPTQEVSASAGAIHC